MGVVRWSGALGLCKSQGEVALSIVHVENCFAINAFKLHACAWRKFAPPYLPPASSAVVDGLLPEAAQ